MLINPRNRSTLLFTLMVVVIVSLIFYADQINRNDGDISSSRTKMKTNNPTIFFHGMNPPSKLKCDYKCDYQKKAIFLNKADAVVFETPNKNLTRDKKDQIWIFTFMESPHNPNFSHFPADNLYNWTMTFRHDSDVPQLYGRFHPKNKAMTMSSTFLQKMSTHTLQIDQKKLAEYKKKFHEKNKLIGWASSRRTCDSPSQREILVDKLSQLVPVDRYGSCGTHKCAIGRFSTNFRSCYAQLGKVYKFYLSFENSLCLDYVTEKFFSALAHDMVPIVYGDADYQKVAPPGSYINALDFDSVKSLADYLLHLDQHPEEYFKFFEWKQFYNIQEWRDPQRFCVLCKKLWDISIISKEDGQRRLDPNYVKIITNVSTWWSFRPNPFSVDGEFEGLEPACREPPIVN